MAGLKQKYLFYRDFTKDFLEYSEVDFDWCVDQAKEHAQFQMSLEKIVPEGEPVMKVHWYIQVESPETFIDEDGVEEHYLDMQFVREEEATHFRIELVYTYDLARLP